jgi:hypothetical protein
MVELGDEDNITVMTLMRVIQQSGKVIRFLEH